jgi:hypothetical protein
MALTALLRCPSSTEQLHARPVQWPGSMCLTQAQQCLLLCVNLRADTCPCSSKVCWNRMPRLLLSTVCQRAEASVPNNG